MGITTKLRSLPPSFRATYYAPGSNGQAIYAECSKAGIRIYLGPGQFADIAWQPLKINAGGFNDQQLIISWQEDQRPFALILAEKEAQQVLLDVAPATIHQQLGKFKQDSRKVRRRFKLGWVVLGVILSLPLWLLLLFWWQSPRLVSWAVDRIPPKLETQIGDLGLSQIKQSGTLVMEGRGLQVVTDIGKRLTKDSKYTYRWYLAKDTTINAFALPGGIVVVNTGLISSADSAEELAGVLAHEVQHVERRHSLKALVHNLGWQAVLSLVMGDLSSSVWANLANQIGGLKFGRDQESEADKLGLLLLQKAQINPEGMLTFFEKLKQQDKGPNLSLLSTHPASTERLQILQKLIEAEPAKNFKPLPYLWTEIKKSVL